MVRLVERRAKQRRYPLEARAHLRLVLPAVQESGDVARAAAEGAMFADIGSAKASLWGEEGLLAACASIAPRPSAVRTTRIFVFPRGTRALLLAARTPPVKAASERRSPAGLGDRRGPRGRNVEYTERSRRVSQRSAATE